MGKKLWSENKEGEPLKIYRAFNERDEASFVVDIIKNWIDEGRSLNDVAILYRSNAQSRVLEDSILRAELPYRIYGGVRFYERMEIKNVISYLRLIVNRNDNTAFERAISVPPRGIGEKTIANIRASSQEQEISLFQASKNMLKDGSLKGKASASMEQFANFIETSAEQINEFSSEEFVEMVISKSGLIDHHMKEAGEKGRIRVENINELISAVKSLSPPIKTKTCRIMIASLPPFLVLFLWIWVKHKPQSLMMLFN